MKPNPYTQCAATLKKHINKQVSAGAMGITCELGTITSTGLKLDSFKHEIQDYMVAEWMVKLTLPAFSISGTQSGLKDGSGLSVTGTAAWSFSPTAIDQANIEVKPDLKPGDRVLCIPVNNGRDTVVICKVASS